MFNLIVIFLRRSLFGLPYLLCLGATFIFGLMTIAMGYLACADCDMKMGGGHDGCDFYFSWNRPAEVEQNTTESVSQS